MGWFNFCGGVYFVTICTAGREHYFGEIVRTATTEQQMVLSPMGQYAHEQFANAQTHYPYAEIPLFVVMPNHIHAVVIIDGEKIPNDKRRNVNQQKNDTTSQNVIAETWCCRDAVHHVSTGKTDAIHHVSTETDAIHHVSTETDAIHHVSTNRQRSKQMTDICNMQGWLSVVVGGLKRAITHYANETNTPFAWQPRFYDRIIRNADEMNRIAEYIERNVARWGTQDEDELGDCL